MLRAIDFPTVDHRGPEFGILGKNVIAGMKRVFKSTHGEVVIYPASGTGAWEAALVNTLSPGDLVLMYETGHFATLWQKMAAKLGLNVEFIAGDWRHGADPQAIEKRLRADTDKRVKAVAVVHNETSTGVTSRLAEVRQAIDAAKHPALYMVDTISSLASIDYRHDEWGVDVTVAGSQKGLMLPPGLSFNCISSKALAASKSAKLARAYWAWDEMIENGKKGYFPYTPATNMLYGLAEALKMLLDEEGLDNVFARHQRHAEATRRAVRASRCAPGCATTSPTSRSRTKVLAFQPRSANACSTVSTACRGRPAPAAAWVWRSCARSRRATAPASSSATPAPAVRPRAAALR